MSYYMDGRNHWHSNDPDDGAFWNQGTYHSVEVRPNEYGDGDTRLYVHVGGCSDSEGIYLDQRDAAALIDILRVGSALAW